ncbi:hypothetical protein BY996DRAFT_7250536 [Phakopsora pachyrhizi]|nr:hypothetical protein BY996DRAFT_7250536 [Phakopsora pachyrhizi]
MKAILLVLIIFCFLYSAISATEEVFSSISKEFSGLKKITDSEVVNKPLLRAETNFSLLKNDVGDEEKSTIKKLVHKDLDEFLEKLPRHYKNKDQPETSKEKSLDFLLDMSYAEVTVDEIKGLLFGL